MKERGQGRPEGAPPSQKNAQLKEQGGHHKESAANNPSGTLSSIRADQDVETFVADLRQNKEQLLSLAQELMRNRGNTREERNAYVSVGGYLDVVLKQYVFGIDPFAIKRPIKFPGDEELQELKEVLAFELITSAASQWLKKTPDSKAAKAVSKMGHFASPAQHYELLQEMCVAIHSLRRSREK
jgi:hypothetical protein